MVVKTPPDGGYGWVIVCASALTNVVIIPLMQSFGLIFKDTFINLGLSATQGSLIINVNSAFGFLVGLINGVLLKIYGYRKIAFVGSTLITTGIIGTAYSTTFVQFIISYGLITSLGMGMSISAYSLALNSYFRKNRSRATGYCMTITGLGPILIPQVITLLMKYHTVQGTTLILGGIASHSFISASLLRPVKWYMKTVEDVEKVEAIEEKEEKKEKDDKNEKEIEYTEEKKEILEQTEEDTIQPLTQKFGRSISTVETPRIRTDSTRGSNWSIDHDQETAAIYGMESALAGSVMSLHSAARRQSISSRRYSLVSRHTNVLLVEEPQNVYNPELSKPLKKESALRRFWKRFSSFFDFDLLKDPIYVNIMIGMSFAIFAELNFSVLTAFILADIGLNTDQSATFMTIIGVADIIFRFLAPYIGEYMNQPPRLMYMFTLSLLIITRFTLLMFSNYYLLLCVALGLGIAKGVRTVFMSLVIPSYVPLEKLASASGIQMMVNGLIILIGGPLLGVVRDLTGSYNMCIVIMNCVTFTTIVMWTTEFLVLRFKKKQNEGKEETNKEQNGKLLEE